MFIYFSWTDARRPVPRLWIRSAEVGWRGGGGGKSLEEWEHNNNKFIYFGALVIEKNSQY